MWFRCAWFWQRERERSILSLKIIIVLFPKSNYFSLWPRSPTLSFLIAIVCNAAVVFVVVQLNLHKKLNTKRREKKEKNVVEFSFSFGYFFILPSSSTSPSSSNQNQTTTVISTRHTFHFVSKDRKLEDIPILLYQSYGGSFSCS